ncbi:MAG: cytochrome c biogenesis protein ResB [Micavibrio sp.]
MTMKSGTGAARPAPTTKAQAQKWLAALASPRILLYALPWLMLLLAAGTVAQKDLGLYAAQNLYFSAWIVWLGPLPLPGTYAALSLITLCLLAKFLFYSRWSLKRAGTILTHFGVLVLMIGGLLTALTQEEGYLALHEGEEKQVVSDYHDREFVIEKDGKPHLSFPFETLKAGQTIEAGGAMRLTIADICRHCRPHPAPEEPAAAPRRGLAAKIMLRKAAPEKEDEANLSGLTFRVESPDAEQNGLYIAMEDIPHRAALHDGGSSYEIFVRRRETILPFSVTLARFQRDMHPGTDNPRSFTSAILINDDGVEWPAQISMNEPLRYKGYTFYQSSFAVRPDGEVSILSVVRNKGRVFPYIASALIFAGLVLHVFLRAREKSMGGKRIK